MKQILIFVISIAGIIGSSQIARGEETVKVPMSYTVETCIPAKILWNQFEISMKDSKGSWIWPTDLSEVSGEGVKANQKIDVLYKIPFMSQLYSYTLSEIEEGSQFRYSAIKEKHPFVGGALIQIAEGESGRQLSWIGEYETASGQWFARLFF